MQKLVQPSLFNRRLVTVVAIAALLAAVFLFKLPALNGTAAVHTVLPILTRCSTADISADYQPQLAGTKVILTASSTGCDLPVYKFLLLAPGASTWAFITDYTSATTYSWDTTLVKTGTWQIGVWARDVRSLTKYDSYSISTVSVFVPFCTGANINKNVDTVTPSLIHVYGAAYGCPVAFIEFWMLAPGSSTWVLVRPYDIQAAATDHYDWDTTGAKRGQYELGLWGREQESTHSYDVYAIVTLTLT